ncbi:MAG TPA: hypothetical protein VGS21_11310 [Acidimicrobiales bacterium]|nr:hypothetical protein [Acidimicrobiales bacterium]
MSPDPMNPVRLRPASVRHTGAAAMALMVVLALGGCSVISRIHNVVKAAGKLSTLTADFKRGENATYEATYKSTDTSGGAASTVTFAQASGGRFAFIEPANSSGGGGTWVGDGKNIDVCTQQGTGTKWSCLQTPEPSAGSAASGNPYAFYSGGYWAAILEALDVSAALSGYKIDTSTQTVNGIKLDCTTITGESTDTSNNGEYCVTGDGILGLVKTTTSTFEITSLSTSPPSSVFEPPAGATINTIPTSTT